MNEHERFRIPGTLHLVKYISILPGIAALFAFQNSIEFASLVLNQPVEKSHRSKCSPNRQAARY